MNLQAVLRRVVGHMARQPHDTSVETAFCLLADELDKEEAAHGRMHADALNDVMSTEIYGHDE